jgi:hypothetical protein
MRPAFEACWEIGLWDTRADGSEFGSVRIKVLGFVLQPTFVIRFSGGRFDSGL